MQGGGHRSGDAPPSGRLRKGCRGMKPPGGGGERGSGDRLQKLTPLHRPSGSGRDQRLQCLYGTEPGPWGGHDVIVPARCRAGPAAAGGQAQQVSGDAQAICAAAEHIGALD